MPGHGDQVPRPKNGSPLAGRGARAVRDAIVEQLDGMPTLLRQYFPRGTNPTRHSRDDLDAVALALNTRPPRPTRPDRRPIPPPPASPDDAASAVSLLRRLELAHRRIQHLTDENQQLRDQLARARGQRRAECQTGPTKRAAATTIGPCS